MNRRSMQNGAPASTGFRYDMLAEAVLRPTKKTLEKRAQKASEKAAKDAAAKAARLKLTTPPAAPGPLLPPAGIPPGELRRPERD